MKLRRPNGPIRRLVKDRPWLQLGVGVLWLGFAAVGHAVGLERWWIRAVIGTIWVVLSLRALRRKSLDARTGGQATQPSTVLVDGAVAGTGDRSDADPVIDIRPLEAGQ